MVDIKSFKKWVVPILMFIFCEFVLRKKILNGIFSGKIFCLKLFDNPNVNCFFWGGVGCIFFSCIVFLFAKFIYDGKVNSIDNLEKVSFKKSILISIMFFIFTMVIIYMIKYIEHFVCNISVSSLNGKYVMETQKRNISIGLFSIVCISIFEEMVYRQILFGYLYDLHSGCNRHVRFITSLLVSAIIFGAIHDGALSSGMIYYVIAGISFTVVYYYTKRISAAIAIHFLYDVCLQSIMMYIYSQ